MHTKKTAELNNVDKAINEIKSFYSFKGYSLESAVKGIENNDFDLSIIVPVYNASKYLRQCIQSLLNQKTTYTYEVICVDDGSTDDSLEILNSYSCSYLKIIHQNNGGISKARNTGLMVSRGKYIGFVDNDDSVSDEYVEKLMKEAFDNDADYVKCGYTVVDDSNNKSIERTSFPNLVMNDYQDFERNHEVWLKGYMWGGCYKRTIWEGFCFPEGYWYEDLVKNIYLYGKCRTLVNIRDCLYYKRKHMNNAADILWKKNNKKCLDQLYLVLNLCKMNDKNIATYYAELSELGEYLYKRIRHLPEEIKKNAFVVACDIIQRENKTDIDKTSFKIKQIQKALMNDDYALWNMVGKYSCY